MAQFKSYFLLCLNYEKDILCLNYEKDIGTGWFFFFFWFLLNFGAIPKCYGVTPDFVLRGHYLGDLEMLKIEPGLFACKTC